LKEAIFNCGERKELQPKEKVFIKKVYLLFTNVIISQKEEKKNRNC